MKRLTTVLAVAAAMALVPATAALAHPLGNFTVSHYDGLTISTDRVEDAAVLDTAEIPTAQERSAIDRDGDGASSGAELAAYAASRCGLLAGRLDLTVDGRGSAFDVLASDFTYQPGAAGLATGRLTCRLEAPVAINGRHRVVFADRFESDRIGWREITANGAGVVLDRSPVPTDSLSAELRRYPNDLLSSPLDVRTATLSVEAGTGVSTRDGLISAIPSAGPLTRALASVTRGFTGLVGRRDLTLGVGLAALGLSLLLGASHAALPGHGKTVMAAYLAGRRGSRRDALTVGLTVTVTHTAGVLLLGLALSLSAALAGDAVLAVLGVGSGLLITAVGVGLFVGALRRHQRPALPVVPVPVPVPVAAGMAPIGHEAALGHSDGEGGSHDHGHGHGHHHGHGHDHDPSHSSRAAQRPLGRAGLVGMGIAGGLVPSPSALVVLLGAVALGRTAFGVLLVIGYGVGMAATLTVAGLILVRLRDRLESGRLARHIAVSAAVTRAMPVVTAGVVIVVGLGLAFRGLSAAV